mmetsp:Transcript_15112/g.57423  ORF Transcript_15112/g.57423 Transcript_15112/m.57423 type:complete len:262 (-) Transcript_15112:2126-2911(-)
MRVALEDPLLEERKRVANRNLHHADLPQPNELDELRLVHLPSPCVREQRMVLGLQLRLDLRRLEGGSLHSAPQEEERDAPEPRDAQEELRARGEDLRVLRQVRHLQICQDLRLLPLPPPQKLLAAQVVGLDGIPVRVRRLRQELVHKELDEGLQRYHEDEREGGDQDDGLRTQVRLGRGAVAVLEEAAILVAVQLALVFLADVLPQILIVAEVLVVGVDHLIHDRGHEESRVNGGSEVQDSNESRGRIAFMEAQRIEGVVP